MQLEHVTLMLFTAYNGIRLFAYDLQIHKTAIAANGASAISRTTRPLFLVANMSAVLYALISRSDPWLALCFSANALCCIVIVAIAPWKLRRTRGRRWERPWTAGLRGLRPNLHQSAPK